MYQDKTLVCKDCGKEFVKGTKEYFTTVCANCSKEARVPFKPREDRPVLCSDCFAAKQAE